MRGTALAVVAWLGRHRDGRVIGYSRRKPDPAGGWSQPYLDRYVIVSATKPR